MLDVQRGQRTLLRTLLLGTAITIAYVASARLGLALSVAQGNATPVWAPTGIAIASLVLFGRRMWPAIALGAFIANVATPISPVAALGIALGNTAEAYVAAVLLSQFGFREELDRVKDVALLVGLAAIASTMVSATVGLGSLVLAGEVSLAVADEQWLIWWVGDMMGALLVAPLLLIWIGGWNEWPRGRGVEAALLSVATIGVCAFLFLPQRWALSYLLFPLLLWATLRFRQYGATMAVFVVVSVAIWRNLVGLGPPGITDPTFAVGVFQAIIAVVGISLLVLAATVSERNRAELTLLERKRVESQIRRALDREHEALEKLQALDSLKTTFLHAVSHDLRTPLTSVLGLAMTLERKDVELDDEERRELAGRITLNARKLDRLLSDLLDLERLDRGVLEPHRVPTDLGALVLRMIQDTDLGNRPLHVHADSVVIPVDGPKIERIVENLLVNVARHTPPDTEVWVRVREEGGTAVVEVEDAGRGIPESDASTVFEPFGRPAGPEESKPGLGIGLSLVRSFAEIHGGTAMVVTGARGGALFRVTLPQPASKAGLA